MNEITINKLSQPEFDKLASSFELDLLAYFNILQDVISNMSFNGKSEDEINKEIEALFE
jgi:hypothetical protein